MSVQAMMATILQNQLELRGAHSLPSSDHEAIIEPRRPPSEAIPAWRVIFPAARLELFAVGHSDSAGSPHRMRADDVHFRHPIMTSKPPLQTSVELRQERQHRILVGSKVRDSLCGYSGDEHKRDGDGLMGHRRLPAARLP
jgi:hypothetical protein